MQTNRTPELGPEGGRGGFPLTMTLPPNICATWGMAHIGKIRPMRMRVIASMIPKGIHKMMRSEVDGVGRLTRRPSWKITGRGRMSWRLCFLLLMNGGWHCSCHFKFILVFLCTYTFSCNLFFVIGLYVCMHATCNI